MSSATGTVWRELERSEQRVLAALRCVDATTGATIGRALHLQGERARVLRNRSGLYVLTQVQGLEAVEASFALQPALEGPPPAPLQLALTDPAGQYLPRWLSLPLPRQADPSRAAQAGSLFQSVDVPMYPAASAPTAHHWSVLRLTVSERSSKDLLGGALVLARQGSQVLARALSDGRGEVLLAVPGVPVTTWSTQPGEVVVDHITAQLMLVFDPGTGTRLPAALLGDTPQLPQPRVDPDDLERLRNSLPRSTATVRLSAGQTQTLAMSLNLP